MVWSLATYSLIMNCPVPIGFVCTWSPLSRTALGDTMERFPDAA